MPNTKSAKKRLRQNIASRERNRAIKRAVRTQCRKVLEAVQTGSLDEAETQLRLAAKKLDQAGAKHVIHRNAAARTKSRLSARVKTLKQRAVAT